MKDKLRVGIIGMGRMGEIRKREIDLHPGMEVVAVTDVKPIVKEKHPSLYKEDWKGVVDSDLNAVFVCTFNDVIAEIVCASLDKGLHVFSEKPPGKTVECIQRMSHSEQKAKTKVLKFGFNHRFHYSVMKAKEVVDSGQFGRILWARGSYGKAGEAEFENIWRSDVGQAGGGILLDQGIHMADLLIYFMGEFIEIKSMVETQYWKIPMEDNAHALLKSRDGAVAMLHSSATHWYNHFSLEIGLEEAIIHLDGILSNSMSYAPEKLIIYRKDFNPTDRKLGNPEPIEEIFERDDSWRFEVEDFYNAIVQNQKIKCGGSEDALKVMNLIKGIYENAK